MSEIKGIPVPLPSGIGSDEELKGGEILRVEGYDFETLAGSEGIMVTRGGGFFAWLPAGITERGAILCLESMVRIFLFAFESGVKQAEGGYDRTR